MEDDYKKYRGKCKEFSEAAVAADPTLRLVRGYYYDHLWGKQAHWWTVRQDGTIFDPTKDQFPSKGLLEYEEFDGYFECANCGKRPFKTREYYRYVLNKACNVVYVCEPGYDNWKMQKRNMFMVDHSTRQIALHDGTKGGTYNCVKYAKAKEVESINVWSEWIKCAVYYGLLSF